MTRSNCVGLDPEMFFVEGNGNEVRAHTEYVKKAICGPCPTRARCLADTLTRETGAGKHVFGIAGGMSPRQRRVLTSKQRDALIQAGAA